MSYVVVQGTIRLILTAPSDPSSVIAQHVNLHGDGVKDIALRVPDVAVAFGQADEHRARPLMEPMVIEDHDGRVVKATIATFGEMVHTFVQRDEYHGPFLPAYQPLPQTFVPKAISLTKIDHFGVSVEAGTLDEWVEYYRRVLCFQQIHQEHVVTANSAMYSSVV